MITNEFQKHLDAIIEQTAYCKHERRFSGRTAIITLDETKFAKIELVKSYETSETEKYDAIRITVCNTNTGIVDSNMIYLGDIGEFGCGYKYGTLTKDSRWLIYTEYAKSYREPANCKSCETLDNNPTDEPIIDIIAVNITSYLNNFR